MDKDEQFILNEVDFKTPKQSPQSNQTWPMDKIQQSRFQLNMSSLLSPATPKRNYSISNAKSLLLQCLLDSKSNPLPRRRFRDLCSDEGVVMDGVLVKSATGKKVSPSCSLGRSTRSLVVRSQQRNAEFSSPRSENKENTQPQHSSGGNEKILANSPSTKLETPKENTRPQHSSGGKGKILANSPCTKLETPKAANPSKLQATAKPFIAKPRSPQMLASPVPLQHHDPHFQWGGPLPLTPPSYGHPYMHPSYAYLTGPPVPYLLLPASPYGPELYQTHHLGRFPRPTGYQMPHDFNQSPSSNQTNTNTSSPPVHSPISTNPTTANRSTSTTTHGSRLDSPPVHSPISTNPTTANLSTHGSRLDSPLSVDGHDTVTQKLDLFPPSDELETYPDLTPTDGLGTMETEKEWSPSDDGLPTFTQAQTDFMESHNRVLPDDVFERFKYKERLPYFTQLCLDGNLPPQPKPQEDQ